MCVSGHGVVEAKSNILTLARRGSDSGVGSAKRGDFLFLTIWEFQVNSLHNFVMKLCFIMGCAYLRILLLITTIHIGVSFASLMDKTICHHDK